MSRLPHQLKMAHWLQAQGYAIEGRTFYEVGTGYIPLVPIGFFLAGAQSVMTVDLYPKLHLQLTRDSLEWIVAHRRQLEPLYRQVTDAATLRTRFDLLERWQHQPMVFLQRANIIYQSPADAAATNLPDGSIGCHFSVNVFEHIPRAILQGILKEARRVLAADGVAIHFIDPSDHFQHQDARITRINFLQFNEQQWMRIAGNPFGYCNRLRASDYAGLFAEASLQTIRQEGDVDQESLTHLWRGFATDAAFHHCTEDDLCTTYVRIMAR